MISRHVADTEKVRHMCFMVWDFNLNEPIFSDAPIRRSPDRAAVICNKSNLEGLNIARELIEFHGVDFKLSSSLHPLRHEFLAWMSSDALDEQSAHIQIRALGFAAARRYDLVEFRTCWYATAKS